MKFYSFCVWFTQISFIFVIFAPIILDKYGNEEFESNKSHVG